MVDLLKLVLFIAIVSSIFFIKSLIVLIIVALILTKPISMWYIKNHPKK